MSSKNPELEGLESPEAVKKVVLEHLNKHKRDLNDDGNILKAAAIRLSGDKGAPKAAMVMELLKDAGEGGAASEDDKREQLSSMIEGLVQNVQTDSDRIVVVNVNTPAVDLQKDFGPDELHYIRDDIFRNIRQQLGAEFQEDVEHQWDTAFNAIMDVVKKEKKISQNDSD